MFERHRASDRLYRLSIPAPKEDIRLGILNMTASVALFAVMSVLVKWLARFPAIELAFFRQLFALVPIGLMLWHAGGGLRLLKTERPVGHATRALIGSTSMILVFSAFQMLPLADATALSFAQPLFLTALQDRCWAKRFGCIAGRR
jgi:drug/metabolite transporter (DMT)-like permease